MRLLPALNQPLLAALKEASVVRCTKAVPFRVTWVASALSTTSFTTLCLVFAAPAKGELEFTLDAGRMVTVTASFTRCWPIWVVRKSPRPSALHDGAALASKSCGVEFKVPVRDERMKSKQLEVNVWALVPLRGYAKKKSST
jgi:hypothetical protein